jgi:hypothetical protein
MNREMTRLLSPLLLALLAALPTLKAEAPAALDLPRQAVEKADFRLTGRLVRVDAAGARMTYPITIKAHWFPGVLRVLVDVAAPANPQPAHTAPVKILLELKPQGQNTIRVAHPGDVAPVNLPVERWTEGVAGTGFSYEDFFEEQYFWAGQQVTPGTRYGARVCDLVKSTPGPTDRTHYSEVRTWLDHGTGFPVYVEKTPKGKEAVKEFTYFGLRQTGGVWSASQVEEKTRGQTGSSLLIFDRGSPKAGLNTSDFSVAQLTRF